MKLLEVERRFLERGSAREFFQGVSGVKGGSIPRAHGEADGGADVATTADVQIAW